MDRFTFSFTLNSPRSANPDTYNVVFDETGITVTQGGRTAQWSESPGVWSGFAEQHAWLAMMRCDSIHAPEGVETAIQDIWQEWKNETMRNDTVVIRVGELAAWINQIMAARPLGPFWNRVFGMPTNARN